nr:peptidoglycan DD-metalloendopeptidase family protein [Phenylobacterium aquaticum]
MGLVGLLAAGGPLGFVLGAHPGSTPERWVPAAAVRIVAGRSEIAGIDLDGDGQPDIARPVANPVRGVDVYGSGAFGAARDGGRRTHHGVDLVAVAGEAVRAPIAGVITRIGPAYAGQDKLQFVEIANPTTHYVARVLYVGPLVRKGVTVAAGDFIGTAQSLAERYPKGIINHVHVELTGRLGDRLDPLVVLPPLAAREAPTA